MSSWGRQLCWGGETRRRAAGPRDATQAWGRGRPGGDALWSDGQSHSPPGNCNNVILPVS
eukprot:242553-Prymnesium_polylepis.1